MAENYQFHLQRWSERDKSIKCPHCKRGHGCYKEYVDQNGVPVDAEGHTVGKCDHEQSCGYHLTPAEWFKLNPDQRRAHTSELAKRPKVESKPIEVPGSIVGQFYRNRTANTFLDWVRSLPLNEDQRKSLPYLIKMYAVGTTNDGRIIWWQIDEDQHVRTGKIMQYESNGHRSKDEEGNSIGFGWVHATLRKMYGWWPDAEGYELRQCLFGQHLLPMVPEAEVHIVESEKTAFLMSIFDPDAMTKHLWMATGGLFNLNAAKLLPMKGRTIICYPDANGIVKWREAIRGSDAKMATAWMTQITDDDPQGADISDVILRRLLQPKQTIKNNPQVKYLINRLELTEE